VVLFTGTQPSLDCKIATNEPKPQLVLPQDTNLQETDLEQGSFIYASRRIYIPCTTLNLHNSYYAYIHVQNTLYSAYLCIQLVLCKKLVCHTIAIVTCSNAIVDC